MIKTSTVRALIDPQKKENVSRILNRLGLNHSEAINIFYSLIEEHKGFPFDLRLPANEEANSDSSIDSEILAHLKDSIKKNRKLGKLLAQ